MTKSMKDLLRSALERSNAEYCEIRVEETEQVSIGFRGKDIDQVSESISAGGNVRALVNGGWGFVSFNRLDDLERKVEEACAQARVLGDILRKEIRLYPVEPVEDEVPGVFGTPAFSVPLSEKVNLLGKYNELALSQPEITSTSVRYFDRHTHLHFANSEGTSSIRRRWTWARSRPWQPEEPYHSGMPSSAELRLQSRVGSRRENRARQPPSRYAIRAGRQSGRVHWSSHLRWRGSLSMRLGHLSEADSLTRTNA